MVPVTTLYNKVWWKWCFASFWAQALRKRRHLPPVPWKTLSGALSCHTQVQLSWQCHAGEATHRRSSLSRAQPSSHPTKHQLCGRGCLALCRPAMHQPNTTECWPTTLHGTEDLPPSPAQFPDPLMLCNKMTEFLKHLEPVYVLDILLFSNR